MQPFGGLLASQRLRGVSQPISGCMLAQQPLPLGVTRLKDRKSASGTVLVEQPDETMQLQGREALQYSVTSFHAETKLPTRFGQYRVRAYRHSVRLALTGTPHCQAALGSDLTASFVRKVPFVAPDHWRAVNAGLDCPQTDGGNSFTEPMVIMTGRPEGQSEVGHVSLHVTCRPGWPVRRRAVWHAHNPHG